MVDAGRNLEARHEFAAEHFDFAMVKNVLVVVDREHAAIMPHAAALYGADPRP